MKRYIKSSTTPEFIPYDELTEEQIKEISEYINQFGYEVIGLIKI